MAKLGRPVVPRALRVRFWDEVRSGLPVREAAAAAGVHRHQAEAWFREAGGVTGNAPGAGKGRYLSLAEREEIAVGAAQRLPQAEIARRLGRAASTVSREITRNSPARGPRRYRAVAAQVRAGERARRPKPSKLAVNGELRGWVQGKLEEDWSPEQVSRRLAAEFPDDPEMRVSHETICQALYVQGRGALRRELTRHLRTGRSLRKPRRTEGGRRGRIPGMVNISGRPPRLMTGRCPATGRRPDRRQGREVADRHAGRAVHPVHHAGAGAGREVRGGVRGGGDPGDRGPAGRAAPAADLGPGQGDGAAQADRGRRGLRDLLLRPALALAAAVG